MLDLFDWYLLPVRLADGNGGVHEGLVYMASCG